MKFEHTEAWGFEHAIRGMRNPLESWKKSDSGYGCYDGAMSFCKDCDSEKHYQCKEFVVGSNDLELMQKLIKAGSEHRKFMRQIIVSVDITAPLYWWKEFDTYKIGTVANSTSTMHKLASTPITKECFEHGEWIPETTINNLEGMRNCYNLTKNKTIWKKLIVNLPESWLQTRTVTMNYENLLSMVNQRKNHKLTEWSIDFINWVKTLPYAEELIFLGEQEC